MGLSIGNRILNIGSSNIVNWEEADIFIKDISGDTSLSFANISNKKITLIITNTGSTDRTISFSLIGKTIRNLTDIMTRLRGNRTQIYEFVSDNTGTFIYCLTPLRLEAIYAP
jgi:hypothetical protein